MSDVCGECGKPLEAITPWKSNPCTNKDCPSWWRDVASQTHNLLNYPPTPELMHEIRNLVDDMAMRIAQQEHRKPRQ